MTLGVPPTFLYGGLCQYLGSEILLRLIFGVCDFAKTHIWGL